MRIGRYEISLHNLGTFRLDGGSMFGSVPKNLWSKLIAVDDENCIPLATRCMLIRDQETHRVYLVDCGLGEKWSDKERAIFAINNTPQEKWGFSPAEVTDLILTHLHFDHAGGISYFDRQGALQSTYAGARIHLQRANYENARHPTLKERASYREENITPIEQSEHYFVEGDVEIAPGLRLYQIDGHTLGQQLIEVHHDGRSLLFPTDLIPTSRHLPVPFHMGYDQCAATVLQEKERFLSKALNEESIIVFEHDVDVPAATIAKNDKGHYCVKEVVSA